ncbi:MAG TPA: hypothetical protein PKX48_04700 [Planctomycetota bacterium]|nr:hypothetical protein [Planctomycetota bacterium]NMD35984.1 hypothetical protein [Planctomycetota bacterium]HNR98166.1 hypothetical protein [Planctomycetota bacterium]HNU27361.1 hypothetical protein [Planctomycetota bacterium]HOE29567.1 hypothetical protein [Planctomycetota bacterium]
MDLPRIGLDGGKTGGEPVLDRRPPRDQDFEHADHVRDDLVEVERLDGEPAFPRVGEHLRVQIRGALGGRVGGMQVIVRGRAGREMSAAQIDVADDRRQEVVEVVSDPAREHAQALDSLGTFEVRLQAAPVLLGAPEIGDVAAHRHGRDRSVGRATGRGASGW